MKKALLVVAAVATILTSQAQNFSWGIKAGANLSGVIGKDPNNPSSKFDFVGGVFAQQKISDLFAVSAEVLYSGQGYGMNWPDTDKKAYHNVAYINIPILANFYLTEGLAIKTGIQPGIPLSTKVKHDGTSVNMKETAQFDLSIPVGISYELKCGFLVDLRYNIGVTKLYKDLKAHNSVLQLTVGWRF